MRTFISSLRSRLAGFDSDFYGTFYSDLPEPKTPAALRRHYLTKGSKEGRFRNQEEAIAFMEKKFGPLPRDFSVAGYRECNSDLHIFSHDFEFVIHYLRHGRNEDRAYTNRARDLIAEAALGRPTSPQDGRGSVRDIQLLQIEKAISAGALSDAVDACEKLIPWLDDSTQPVDNDDLIRRIVALAVRLRDDGAAQRALEEMLRLWRLSKERTLCLEILVILVLVKQNFDLAGQFLPTVPFGLLADKHIRLLIGRVQERTGNKVSAVEALHEVSHDDVAMVPSFAALRNQMVLSLTRDVAHLTSLLGRVICYSAFATIQEAMYRTAFHTVFRETELPDNIEGFLLDTAFWRIGPVILPYQACCELLAESNPASQTEKQAVVLRFFVSCLDVERATTLAESLLDTPIVANPDFIKSLFKLADLSGDASWSGRAEVFSRALTKPDAPSPSSWSTRRAVLQHREIAARRLKHEGAPVSAFAVEGALPPTRSLAPTNARPHLFIGIFGQLRCHNSVLPLLRDYLDRDFAPFRNAGGLLSSGVATWNVAGRHKLTAGSPANTITARMPDTVVEILRPFDLTTVSDVCALLPATTARMMDDGSMDVVSDALLKEIFGEMILTAISSDEDFMTGTGAAIAALFPNDLNVLNQGRMWNRIGALAGLIGRSEARAGTPVTHALLTRSDLIFHHGSLCALLTEANSFEPNWIFADFDPAARFIEGIGDRYMLVDRTALDRLLDAERLMLMAAQSTDGVDPRYSARFGAHQFLDTIMFEHGTKLVNVTHNRVQFEIYRGRMSLEDLRQPLTADKDKSTNVSLKRGLSNLLS